ncbi:hypothetical protein DFH09DRAFT_1095253 [Mycena vulgaris]|nr:hypothetical protein DFH09DRAFT_1095253 [Mycena vulgaris]
MRSSSPLAPNRPKKIKIAKKKAGKDRKGHADRRTGRARGGGLRKSTRREKLVGDARARGPRLDLGRSYAQRAGYAALPERGWGAGLMRWGASATSKTPAQRSGAGADKARIWTRPLPGAAAVGSRRGDGLCRTGARGGSTCRCRCSLHAVARDASAGCARRKRVQTGPRAGRALTEGGRSEADADRASGPRTTRRTGRRHGGRKQYAFGWTHGAGHSFGITTPSSPSPPRSRSNARLSCGSLQPSSSARLKKRQGYVLRCTATMPLRQLSTTQQRKEKQEGRHATDNPSQTQVKRSRE